MSEETEHDRMWEALKVECCADPAKAKRIVTLSREQFDRALASLSPRAGEEGDQGLRASVAGLPSAASSGPITEATPSGLAEAALWMRDEAAAMRRGAELLVGGTRGRALANADDLERWAAMIEEVT